MRLRIPKKDQLTLRQEIYRHRGVYKYNDWYSIERVEHENLQEWREVSSDVSAWYNSARISDADVEGTAGEMLVIAKAIETQTSAFFKRCAVEITWPTLTGAEALFLSPRNSTVPGKVPYESALALADLINSTLLGDL